MKKYERLRFYLRQFVFSLLQLCLFLFQCRLGCIQSLTLGFYHPVDAAIHFHGSYPHAQGFGRAGDSPNDVRLEVLLGCVGSNFLQHTVRDVVSVKVHQLFDEILLTFEMMIKVSSHIQYRITVVTVTIEQKIQIKTMLSIFLLTYL